MSPQALSMPSTATTAVTARPETGARAKASDKPATAASAPQPSTTSSLSAAAMAMAKEAAETPAQTAMEAQRNDPQAQRIVARQAALEKAYA